LFPSQEVAYVSLFCLVIFICLCPTLGSGCDQAEVAFFSQHLRRCMSLYGVSGENGSIIKPRALKSRCRSALVLLLGRKPLATVLVLTLAVSCIFYCTNNTILQTRHDGEKGAAFCLMVLIQGILGISLGYQDSQMTIEINT
jgi:hypothetical protein